MNIADLIAAIQSGMDPNKAIVQASIPGAGNPAIPGSEPNMGGTTPPIANVPPTPDATFPEPPPATQTPPVPIPTTPTGVPTPVTNPAPAPDTPKALQSPPDLANMYIKLMQQNQNAALMDSGATLIAAGFSPYAGTREALIRASTGGGRPGLGVTAADLINIEKQQQAMKDTLLRRSLLGGLAKQYKLSPEAALALETSGKLDEVIKHHETQNLQVIEDNATGQKSFFDHRGNKLADIGGPKPEEGEFQEGPGGRQLISKRTGLPMGPGIGQPPKTQVVEGVAGPELRDTTPGGTFTKIGGSAGIKPTEATRADAEMVDLLNAGLPDDQKIGMEHFLTNIKRNPQLAPNAKNIADWRAINAGRPPDKQMGYEEFMTKFGGGGGVNVNISKDGVTWPAPRPGYDYARNPDGSVWVDPGTRMPKQVSVDPKAAGEERETAVDIAAKERAAADVIKKESRERVQQAFAASNVGEAVDTALGLADKPGATGTFAKWGRTLSPVTGMSWDTIDAKIKTIDAVNVVTALNQMRQASPSGGALGNVTENENKMLASIIASPNVYQDTAEFKKGLIRIKAAMLIMAEEKYDKPGDDTRFLKDLKTKIDELSVSEANKPGKSKIQLRQ